MSKYYAVGAKMVKGEFTEAQFLGTIEAKNLAEARAEGFNRYRDEWYLPTGGKQVAVVGKAGYKRYWETLVNKTAECA